MKYAFYTGLFSLVFFFSANAFAREHHVLVIRVDFPFENPDHETTSGRGAFDLSDYYTDEAVQSRYYHPWDIPPHDSRYFSNHLQALDHYWKTVSENRVSISYRIWPEDPRGSYRMSNTFYKYGNGRTPEQTYKKLAELFREAVETCKRMEGARINFSEYDTFMIIHAGIGQETSGGLNDIPSAYLNPEDFRKYLGGALHIDGKELDNGIILPEMASDSGLGGLNGIMAQMFGHRLGLPSLSNNKDGLPAAGGWSLMDTGGMAYGAYTRGFIPAHPDIWSKIELGWLEPVTVTSDTTLDITATHINNGLPRALKIPITGEEYLLIENRIRYASRDSLPEATFSDSDTSGVWMSVSHYDAFIPGSGILVWRINDRIIREQRQSGAINNDLYRRGVDLLEADGRQDIGARFGFGDPRSEYSEGHDDDTFKKNGRDTLSPVTEPNSGSLWGASSGVTVKVNSAPGDVMSLTISFGRKTRRIADSLSARDYITSADFNGDGSAEAVVSGRGSFSLVDTGTGKTFGFGTDAHPAMVSAGGRTAFAFPSGGDLFFYGMDGSDPALLSRIRLSTALFPSNEGGRTVYGDYILRTHIADGEHLLMPARVTQNGRTTESLILDIPMAGFPNVSFHPIVLPDTSRVAFISSAGNCFAAACENGSLYLGEISGEKVSAVPLPSEKITGLVIADLDRDDHYEAIAAAGRNIVFASFAGTVSDARSVMRASPGELPPESVTRVILAEDPIGEPVVADIDLDGYPEVLQCTATKIYAFRAKGAPVSGFPRSLPSGDPTERIISQPIAADLDSDGLPDIAYVTSNQRLIAHNAAGRQAEGFPLALTGPVSGSPVVIPGRDSGNGSLAWTDTTGNLYMAELPASIDNRASAWPMWRGGPGLAASLPNSSITSPVQETASFTAFCYPNPIREGIGAFRFVPEGVTDCRITVFSADGGKVFEHYLPESRVIPGAPNEVKMDASHLASGLYIAKIQTRTRTKIYKLGVLK